MEIEVKSEVETIAVFELYGKPDVIRSDKSIYIPLPDDTENDVFEKALKLLSTIGISSIQLVFRDN
jgi:hypothetical protein